MNIVCRKTKCKYNNNLACQSEKIFIDRELNCEQYEPIEKGSLQDISKNMMETAPKIAPFRHNKDIHIKCQANCVFNKDCHCVANGIFINGQTPKANEKIENLTKNDEASFKDKAKNKHKQNKFLSENKSISECSSNCDCDCQSLNEYDCENDCNYKNKCDCDCKSICDCGCDYEKTNNCDCGNESGKAKCFTFANK